jgi:hypothetical protein
VLLPPDLARAIAILVSCLDGRRQLGVRSGHFSISFRGRRSLTRLEPFLPLRIHGVRLAHFVQMTMARQR